MNNTFLLKKQDKFSELQLSHFVTGIKQIKLILLDLHPEFDSTVLRIYKTFLIAVLLLRKKRKLLIVELVQKNKRMTLKDKKIFLQPNFLIMSWLQTLALGLIGKEKDLKPFTQLSV